MAALGTIELLFLLGPLVVVPLSFRLLGASRPLGAARALFWPGALAATCSLLLPRGSTAGVLAAVWLVVLLLLAGHGLALVGAAGAPGRVARIAACLLVPIGGGWLVVSRLGLAPLGFAEPIPLLTAVHFHFAVFATLVSIGAAGPWLVGRVYTAITAAAIAGPLLVAIGISRTPVLEAVGGTLMAAALAAFAGLVLLRVVPRAGAVPGLLLSVSSLSILMGMACALAWLVGRVTDVGVLSMGQMARVHGPLNALGFAVCGLAGWHLLRRNSGPETR